MELLGTFRLRLRLRVPLLAREAWVLAVVDTVVAVVSSQQKYFSNFCEYEVITFCQLQECLVDKQHKMPQSRQNIARQVAQNISHRTFHSVSVPLKTNPLTRLCTCSKLVVGGRDLLRIS